MDYIRFKERKTSILVSIGKSFGETWRNSCSMSVLHKDVPMIFSAFAKKFQMQRGA